jgi:hypothetical protein
MVQVNKMLKPEKWQATFDSDGKVFGFQKALKLIVLGVCCFIIIIVLLVISYHDFLIFFALLTKWLLLYTSYMLVAPYAFIDTLITHEKKKKNFIIIVPSKTTCRWFVACFICNLFWTTPFVNGLDIFIGIMILALRVISRLDG